MATLNPIQESPNPVPAGSSGTISLTFQTDPGTPDETADLTVYKDGVVQQTATGIVLKGRPAEATPVVQAGSSNVGWEIRTTQGALAPLGNNQFSISY